MKKMLIASMIATSMTLTGCQSTGQSLDPNTVVMNKQLLKMDRAVVLMADPVKAKPSELNKGTEIGAAVAGGGMAAALGGGAYGNRNVAAAGAAVALVGLGAMLVSEMSDQPIPAIRYTVQTMNDGGVSNGKSASYMTEVIQTVPTGGTPIAAGAPVFLKSYSDGTKFVFPDTTQGIVFNKAKETLFQEDIEAKKVADAEAKKQAEKQAKIDAENKADKDWLKNQAKRRIEAETSRQETHSNRTDDKIDASIRASDNISKTDKTLIVLP